MDTIVERLTLGKVVEETMETNRRERRGKQQRRKAMDNDSFLQDMYGGQDWDFSSLIGEGTHQLSNTHASMRGRTDTAHCARERAGEHAHTNGRARTGVY